ncbi:tannase and feruloyl esterase [Mycena belliarum]|uniref:Carboxylic ester hydrolase n=1 Tax=Mycena belliarum TaxID=1033014 RepID=A0AAD6TR91_9AGAR|nr:tannase and feruloyl esterase [Mycena belliae]
MLRRLAVPALLLPVCPLATDITSLPARCLTLQHTLHLENTTILNVTHIPAPATVATPGSCQSSATVTSAPLCRVQFVINTTSTSAVHAEAWLPDTWFGRFLATGNGGTGGCIDYGAVDYGASLHFAAFGTDNGHDGAGGGAFLDHPEVVNDFAFRAIHVEAVIGKQLTEAYYGRQPAKSYYLGCSTGGRQGTQAALRFPADFDGIVAGAPATDWNHLMGWSGLLGHFVGTTTPGDESPPPNTSPKFIPAAMFPLVSAEILRQCDALDGIVDGIISEPDDCDFNPQALQCAVDQTSGCLTPFQVQTLRNIFSPVIGTDGNLIYPRYSPGAEADPVSQALLGPVFFQFTADWERFAVLNVTTHNFTDFGLQDIALFDKINPGGISTFDGHLEAFRARGGKFLTYHGRRDPLISSTNSKRMYELIASTLGTPSLDDFYRLFLIPGMGHCSGGLGPTAFGQGTAPGLNVVNASSHNILLALVDWVENGAAPATVVGSGANGTERTFCRFPMQSVFNGTPFVCTD